MDYKTKLIIRMLLAILILIIPINIFYLILLKPTLFIAYLNFLIYDPRLISNGLIIGNDLLRFVPACIASSAYYLLIIIILFTKGLSLKKSLYLFLIGSLIIFIGNLIRIDFLIFILIEFGVDYFNKLHLFIWQFLSSIFVALVWIYLTIRYKIKTVPVYSDIIKILSFLNKKNKG